MSNHDTNPLYREPLSQAPLHERSWQLRWQRFAQSPAHRVLALVAALCVTHGAIAQHRADSGQQSQVKNDLRGSVEALVPASTPVQLQSLEATPASPRQGKGKGKGKARPKPRPRLQGVLNINKASAQQWQVFPGVGPAIANKILKHRQNKTFRSVKQLSEVKGIGPKFIQRFAEHLRINGPTTLSRKGGSGTVKTR